MTHANPLSASKIKRNKSDELIRTLASRGGVMGIVAIAEFLADYWRTADLARYCDQIDYVAELVGIDHFAIGSDFTEGLSRSDLEPLAWGGAALGPSELEANGAGSSPSAGGGSARPAWRPRPWTNTDW